MKLDRNTNPDGQGKYALIHLRKIADESADGRKEVLDALNMLKSKGILTYGNESPGDQFFVMKYKDRFTAPAMKAYAEAARDYAFSRPLTVWESSFVYNPEHAASILEYSNEIEIEALAASRVGGLIPT